MVPDPLLEGSPNIRFTDASFPAFTATLQLRHDPVLQPDLRGLPPAMFLLLPGPAGPEPDLRHPVPESPAHLRAPQCLNQPQPRSDHLSKRVTNKAYRTIRTNNHSFKQ